MLWDELQDAIKGVLRSGHFIMGPNVKAFEEEVAAYLGVKHAIGLNSGTDALFIALRALGIGPGDEVITSPFTFFATAEAISHVGATPVFVDIDPVTYTMDVNLVRSALTSRTKAIIPVHIYGQAVDMGPLMEIAQQHGLKIVEDVAQAFGGEYSGQKLGTMGDIGAFSFFPSKNLGAFGDGGLLTTNDDSLAEMTRMLRVHGSKKKYHNEVVGYNSRLDELQASILRVKLPRLDKFNDARRRVADHYRDTLASIAGIVPPAEAPYAKHVYHQYTVQVENGKRDIVQSRLAAVGIGTMIYYPIPVHKLPVYSMMDVHLPVAEHLAQRVLALPMGPFLNVADIEAIAHELAATLE